ncbi:hypothetical protein TZ96_01818 [Streptococcus infantis]|uniref:Drug/metabolite transporter (DMT) superfamily protein n=1 Tax=Streptococcus infantis TaxID=68892 RepID=A0A0F3H896_9STRE|nr:hypothetical protein TZ96_01818 [Streptococcus infantis]
MSKALKGTLFTVIAGIAWGLSGTSGQYLMAHGISALVLTKYPFDNCWITLASSGLY